MLDYSSYLDSTLFGAMPSNGDRRSMYDTRADRYRLTAAGTWIKRWVHWGGRGAVLRAEQSSLKTTLDMPFLRCHEELGYTTLLSAIIDRLLSKPLSSLEK